MCPARVRQVVNEAETLAVGEGLAYSQIAWTAWEAVRPVFCVETPQYAKGEGYPSSTSPTGMAALQ